MSGEIGLFIFLALGVILVFFTVVQRKKPYTLRELPAFQGLRRAIGLAVEDGRRIHVALGRGNVLSETFGSALIGLGVFKRFTGVALIADRPPIATSGEGSLMLLAQQGLQAAHRRLGILPQDLPRKALLTGTTFLSYAVGSQMEIRDERVAIDILIGNTGHEAALICDASHQQGNFSIAGSDDLTAQAVFVAAATHSLLGEEVYAAVAYIADDADQRASLQTQDLARWIIILLLILTSVIKLIGL